MAEQRITRRSLGAGRKRELDSDDEEWLLKCIEDKATIHRRRHESVLYTHHRVKTRDLLNIANYRRYKQGKRLLRSVSSVATRARPTNKRSQQAKRHIGKGLWCSKKPPKMEDHGNECTHHQRKQVKLAKEIFFSATNEDASLCISMDDKAYLRPEISEGAKGARQQTILQPSDKTLARALPVHDYPEASVYITPSAFTLIRKKTEVVDDKVTLIADTDDSIVVVEPKASVLTNASTWALNSMRLRWEKPNLHEACNLLPQSYTNCSEELRWMYARIHDAAFYFIDTTTAVDMQSGTEASDCSFRTYEGLRLHSLKQQVTSAKENWGGEMEDNDRDLGVSVYEKANALLENIEKAESEMWKVKSRV